MGKASSTKKVARAARTGGKQTSQKRNLGFPALLIGVVVLGIALIAFAVVNNRSVSANTDKPRAQGQGTPSDHWHDAFGVDICGQLQPAVSDRADDAEGIHTHGDGVIHIHPFGLRSSGPRATLGRFFEDIGMTVSSSGIKMPDGKVYKVGETTCNGTPGVVTIAHWRDAQKAAAGEKPDKIYTSGFGDIKLTENGGAFTVAFLPKGTVPEAPDTAAKLKELGAVDSGQTSSNATTGDATGGAATGGAAATGGVTTATTGGVDPSTTGTINATTGATTATTGAATAGTAATGGDPSTTGTAPGSSTP